MDPRLPGVGLVGLLNVAGAKNRHSSWGFKQEFEIREDQIRKGKVDLHLKVWSSQ